MRCEDFRDELQLGRAPGAELEAHARSCDACGKLLAEQRALNDLLALDEPHQAGPGFDTRFFARLRDERDGLDSKRRRSSMRVWLWALIPAVAGIAILLGRQQRAASNHGAPAQWRAPSFFVDVAEQPEDLELLEDLELVEDLEVVQHLDALEDFEILADVDPNELDRIASEGGTP